MPGCGALRRGHRPSPGFVDEDAGGAVGCGYYKGHLSLCPYVVATATSGAAFTSEYLNIVGPGRCPHCQKLIEDSVRYTASLVSDTNGTIPYVIDCETPNWSDWPLDTISYVTEGAAAAFIHSPALRSSILAGFNATAEWLLATQNSEGFWGSSDKAADLQRSPRVATLLSLFAAASKTPTPRVSRALVRFVDFLAQHGNGKYGVETILNTSGFVGLALLDMIRFGSTFGTPNMMPRSSMHGGKTSAVEEED